MAKKTIEQLIMQKIRDDAVLHSIGDGLIVILDVDKGGRIIYVNKAFENITGWKLREVLNKPVVDILPRIDKDGETIHFKERIVTRVLAGEKVVADLTQPFYYVRKDKSRFPVASAITPIVFNKKIVGAVETFRDISKESEADKAKTEFASLVSHQLRTPLSAMKWFGEMLLNGDAGKLTKEQKDFVKNIYDSNERMIALVEALLNISRIESGRLIIDPKPTDLRQLVNEIVGELKIKIKEKKQTLVVSSHPNLPKINIDPKLIRNVYQNLLTNASRYSPSGSEISVFISRKGNEIISQISDNGYGIPKKEQTRVFSKFYRGGNIIKLETEGTGLGLYLVKAIIESSGGKIWFESEEGKRTTFWFSLPMSGSKPKKGEVGIHA